MPPITPLCYVAQVKHAMSPSIARLQPAYVLSAQTDLQTASCIPLAPSICNVQSYTEVTTHTTEKLQAEIFFSDAWKLMNMLSKL